MSDTFQCCGRPRIAGPDTFTDNYGRRRCKPCHRASSRKAMRKWRKRRAEMLTTL